MVNVSQVEITHATFNVRQDKKAVNRRNRHRCSPPAADVDSMFIPSTHTVYTYAAYPFLFTKQLVFYIYTHASTPLWSLYEEVVRPWRAIQLN